MREPAEPVVQYGPCMRRQRNKNVALEVCHPGLGGIGQTVACRYGDDEVLRRKQPRFNTGGNVVPATEGDVHVPAEDTVHGRLRKILAEEFDLDTRVVAPDLPGEPAHQGMGGSPRVGHPNAPDFALVRGTDRDARPARGIDDLRCRPDERLSGACQLDAAGASVEQPGSQLTFQLLDTAADRRLRHVKFFCRAAEVQLFCHRQEGSDLLDLHACDYYI